MMTVEEARRIWGWIEMDNETLQQWVDAYNHRQMTYKDDDPSIPKGATITLEPDELRRVTGDDTDDVRHG